MKSIVKLLYGDFNIMEENNTRKGFFEHGDFLALREALPDFLRGFVTFAYKTGWRFS